ncbi:MAG: outer membrane protein transport protein [Myxococcota bacterium]
MIRTLSASTLLLATALAAAPARAAGLDLLEVGGPWGTPGATNPSAIWWNPAGLAVGGGTQFLVEAAPLLGSVTAQRDNPSYGDVDPSVYFEGPFDPPPDTYDYSGTDKLSTLGVVPFLGVSSNFMVPGLGVGLGLAVPTARGGASDQEWGANRYAIRAGDIRAIHAMAGASYQILNKVALGASVSFVNSSYYADTDTSTYPDLAVAVREQIDTAPFQDGYAEQRGYTTTAVLGGEKGDGHGALTDQAMTFGAGVYLTPIGNKLGISLAYNHGVRLDNEGDLTLKFQCPPQWDAFSRLGATSRGLCDADTGNGVVAQGTGSVGYRLPSRIHLGVVLRPIDRVRLEVMGASVMWSSFSDYEIGTNVKADQFLEYANSPELADEAAALVSKPRLWARDAQDTFWVGADGKVRLTNMFSAGARVLYDHHAIPSASVSANNADFDALILGAMGQVNPIDQLGIGLSFSQQVLMSRTVTDSAFALTVDPESAKPARYFYPSANGKYSGSITRLSLAVSGHFGGNTSW